MFLGRTLIIRLYPERRRQGGGCVSGTKGAASSALPLNGGLHKWKLVEAACTINRSFTHFHRPCHISSQSALYLPQTEPPLWLPCISAWRLRSVMGALVLLPYLCVCRRVGQPREVGVERVVLVSERMSNKWGAAAH